MTNLCQICGEPMSELESVFKFHGYSGPCPKPPLPRVKKPSYEELEAERDALKDAYKRLESGSAILVKELEAHLNNADDSWLKEVIAARDALQSRLAEIEPVLKIAFDALQDANYAMSRCKKNLDEPIKDGDPVHPESAKLTYTMSTVLIAIEAVLNANERSYAAPRAAPALTDDDVMGDCTPNHLCKGRFVHLPDGEQCNRCGEQP